MDLLQLPGQPLHFPLHPLQPAQPPFLASFRMERMARITTTARMLMTIKSPITDLSEIYMIDCHIISFFSFGRFIAFAQYQENQQSQNSHGQHGENAEYGFSGEQTRNLVNDHGNSVGKTAHICNGAGSPLGTVHFPLDGAYGGKTGSAQQIEDHETVRTDGTEIGGDHGPDLIAGFAELTGKIVQSTEGHNDLFFGDQAGDSGDGGFPAHIAHPAQGIENPCEQIAHGSQQRSVGIFHSDQ